MFSKVTVRRETVGDGAGVIREAEAGAREGLFGVEVDDGAVEIDVLDVETGAVGEPGDHVHVEAVGHVGVVDGSGAGLRVVVLERDEQFDAGYSGADQEQQDGHQRQDGITMDLRKENSLKWTCRKCDQKKRCSVEMITRYLTSQEMSCKEKRVTMRK